MRARRTATAKVKYISDCRSERQGMGRLIEHEATGPRKLDESDIDPEKGDIAVCQCGLSEEFPFCDGSHRQTGGEAEGATYRYVDDDDGTSERRPVDRVVFADGSEEVLESSAE